MSEQTAPITPTETLPPVPIPATAEVNPLPPLPPQDEPKVEEKVEIHHAEPVQVI